MKVKIDDVIYDSAKVPIMVILTEADKSNINRMPKEANRYCAYPEEEYALEYIKRWMDEIWEDGTRHHVK